MSETIVGRKRTACGTLFEVRAIGENADELTLYVRVLLSAAELACKSMRRMRSAVERAASELESKTFPPPPTVGEALRTCELCGRRDRLHYSYCPRRRAS